MIYTRIYARMLTRVNMKYTDTFVKCVYIIHTYTSILTPVYDETRALMYALIYTIY